MSGGGGLFGPRDGVSEPHQRSVCSRLARDKIIQNRHKKLLNLPFFEAIVDMEYALDIFPT